GVPRSVERLIGGRRRGWPAIATRPSNGPAVLTKRNPTPRIREKCRNVHLHCAQLVSYIRSHLLGTGDSHGKFSTAVGPSKQRKMRSRPVPPTKCRVPDAGAPDRGGGGAADRGGEGESLRPPRWDHDPDRVSAWATSIGALPLALESGRARQGCCVACHPSEKREARDASAFGPGAEGVASATAGDQFGFCLRLGTRLAICGTWLPGHSRTRRADGWLRFQDPPPPAAALMRLQTRR